MEKLIGSEFSNAREPKRKVVLSAKNLKEYLFLLEDPFKIEPFSLEVGLGATSNLERCNENIYFHRSEKYIAHLVFSGKPVSYIWVQRQVRIPLEDDRTLRKYLEQEGYFWNDLNLKPLPVVTDQFTEEGFRGKGLNTFLIAAANEIYARRFGVSLYSHVELREGSQKVWEKLEEKGLAKKIEWQGRARWRCK